MLFQDHCPASEKVNLERHFKTIHKNDDTKIPANCELGIKCAPKAATVEPCDGFHIPATHRKQNADEEFVKEAFLGAADLLLNDLQNKQEITAAIKDIQLSRSLVIRHSERLADNVCRSLKNVQITRSTRHTKQTFYVLNTKASQRICCCQIIV